MTHVTPRTRPDFIGGPTPWSRAGCLLAIAASVVAWSAIVGAQAPDRAQAEELTRRAAARIQALQREADDLASRERTLLEELRRLDVERDLRTEQYAQGALELGRIQTELADTSARLDGLQRVAQSQLPDLTARLVELYKLGRAGYVRLLLNVDDLHEMGRGYRFVSALQALDRRRVADHRRTMAELRRTRASLEQRQAQLQVAQRDVAVARDQAGKAAAAHASLIQQIDRRRDMTAQLMGELQTAQQKLQQRLTAMGTSGHAPAAGAAALPLRPFQGDLDWPVSGPVVGRFGRQANTRFRTAVQSNGIRVAASSGTPVRAIHEGTVAFAEVFTGFGNLVIVDHGGLAFTMYGNLATIGVPFGSRVVRGQPLGTVGASLEGVPSLYFELRVDGRPVDPLQWLRKR